MIPGNLAPTILAFPIRGKAAFVFNVRDEDGEAYTLDPANTYQFIVSKNPTAVALMTLTVGSGLTLLTPYTLGKIGVAFTDPQVLLMSPQKIYAFLFKELNPGAEVVLSNSGRLLPSLEPQSATYVTGASVSPLATNTLNTMVLLGEAGGSGYMDGLATINQDVNCIIEFIDPVLSAPVQWVLLAGTQATVAGEFRRPLDYAVSTNEKYWKRIM